MSIIVILKFAVDDDYIYFFQFSSALLQKPFSFIVGFMDLWICCLCSTCCTETFQRNQEIPLSR